MAEWRDVPGWEGLYKVSDDGRVRTLQDSHRKSKNEEIAQTLRGYGYQYVNLYSKSRKAQFPVHRLVAMAFIPNPENKREVNHKNGIKTDNKVENLEWVTRKENEEHSRRMGFHDAEVRQRSKMVLAIDNETGERKIYYSANEAARELGIGQGSISREARGEGKTTTNYSFYYTEGETDGKEIG